MTQLDNLDQLLADQNQKFKEPFNAVDIRYGSSENAKLMSHKEYVYDKTDNEFLNRYPSKSSYLTMFPTSSHR